VVVHVPRDRGITVQVMNRPHGAVSFRAGGDLPRAPLALQLSVRCLPSPSIGHTYPGQQRSVLRRALYAYPVRSSRVLGELHLGPTSRFHGRS
jgi:hypothetical protein